jgi:hypothetical protein
VRQSPAAGIRWSALTGDTKTSLRVAVGSSYDVRSSAFTGVE